MPAHVLAGPARARRRTRALAPIAVAALLALLACSVGAVTATAAKRKWVACSKHPQGISHLQTSHLSCKKAATAVRNGKFALTPGGPLFSTPGFSCNSPIGPPQNGRRFTVCKRHGSELRFYNSSELSG